MAYLDGCMGDECMMVRKCDRCGKKIAKEYISMDVRGLIESRMVTYDLYPECAKLFKKFLEVKHE